MRMQIKTGLVVLCAAIGFSSQSIAANIWGLNSEGSATLKSAGPMAFGPDGILFVGDTKEAKIYAFDTGDKKGDADAASLEVDNFSRKVAEEFGVAPNKVVVKDIAVNPKTGNAVASIDVGEPLLVMISGNEILPLDFSKMAFAKIDLPNPPEDKQGRRGNPRDSSVTDLAFLDGKLIVSGMTAGPGSTNIREIPFPFDGVDSGSNLEIYHAAHGRTEDSARIRTFVPMMIDGKPNLLAGFVCTPLVRLPLGDIEAGKKVKGTTIAELGNQNQPYDMIVYEKDGKSFVLMANSVRGVMKISTEKIEDNKGLSERVGGGGTAGQPFEKIEGMDKVTQLDKLNDTHAVVLFETEEGSNLKTVALP